MTIHYPYIYERNIQKLIKMGRVANRSDAVKQALILFFQKQPNELNILGYWEDKS